MTPEQRGEITAAMAKAFDFSLTFRSSSKRVAWESALDAALPLIEEHERAGWKRVEWEKNGVVVSVANFSLVKNPSAEGWQPAYVRELGPGT